MATVEYDFDAIMKLIVWKWHRKLDICRKSSFEYIDRAQFIQECI